MVARIIIATDFSEGASAGVERGVALAQAHGATVHLAHVIGAAPTDVAELSGPFAEIQEIRRTAAEGGLSALSSELEGRGLTVERHLLEGRAAEQIAELVDDTSAQLVVMGARGHHAEQVFVIGSVTEAVVRRADTNVLVVRNRRPFHKVLLATDLSRASRSVVGLAVGLAEEEVEAVELVHVVDWGDTPPPVELPFGSPNPHFEQLWKAAIDKAGEELAQLAQRSAAGGEVSHRVEQGVVAARLLERARATDADLVVVGKRRGPAPREDSVSERVVRHAPCTVLVARREL
ncbi:MAG: universal stress protein [Myxococcota bacterium]